MPILFFSERAREDSNSPILKETSKIGRLESIDFNLGQVWDKKWIHNATMKAI